MKEKVDRCAKEFEYVLDEVGHFGYFQKRLFLLSSCLQILAVPVILYFNLLTELPKTFVKHCEDVNGTITENSIDKCVNTTISKPADNIPNWLYKSDDTTTNVNAVFYVQSMGLAVGAILGGFTADLLGRKQTLFLSFALMMLAHSLTVASSDFTFFIIGRLLTNLFAGSFIIPSVVLYTEYIGRTWRDVCVCVCLWWLGTILRSIQAMITHNWIYLAVSTGVIGLPMSGLYFMFPESFRWYCCRQKFPEAEHALREMTSCNSLTKPDVTAVCDNINSTVINSMRVRTYTYLDVFKCRRRFLATVILSIASFASCAVYRCLMERVWSLSNNMYIDSTLRYIVDLPIIFTALIISKCIGRRWCIFLYAMSSGFALMCVLVLSVVNELLTDEDILTGISLFGKLGVASTIVFLFLVALELYPTTIRCMGTALILTSELCGLAVGRYICIALNQDLHVNFTASYIGYGSVMFFVGFLALLLPETYDQPLPDILHSRHRIIATHESTRIENGWHKF